MPRTLFEQVLVTESPRRAPWWMKAGSLVIHVVVVLVLLVLPITAALDLPGIQTRLPTVMLATVPSPPPAPASPAVAATAPIPTTVPSVPLAPPDGIKPEVAPPAPVALGAPGGISSGLPNVGAVNASPLAPPPPPVPVPEPPRRVGGIIRPPERTVFKAPEYPPVAKAARIEGTVVLEATLDERGVVQNVTVLRSVPLLDQAAIDAVRQWRYLPTRLNGVAIPIIMTVTVTFSIR
jgi:protein TonB